MVTSDADTKIRAWTRKAVATIPLEEHRREKAWSLVFVTAYTLLITVLVVMITIRWYGPLEVGSPSQIVATLAISIGLIVLVTKTVQESWAFSSYDQIAAITGSEILQDLEYRHLTAEQTQLVNVLLRRLTDWTEGAAHDTEIRAAIAALVREMHDSSSWCVRDMVHWRLIIEARRYHKVTDSHINPYHELGW